MHTVLMFLSSQTHLEEDKQFVLLDDDEDDEGEGDIVLEEDGENEVEDVAGYALFRLF